MLKGIESTFPTEVDPLIFFQDANLDRQTIMETYNALIAAGQYDDANVYIETQKEIYGYWANYLNAIENRIYATQDYEKNNSESAMITERTSYDTDTEPTATGLTHAELSQYTHAELSDLIHGYMDPDEYIWITGA